MSSHEANSHAQQSSDKLLELLRLFLDTHHLVTKAEITSDVLSDGVPSSLLR